MAAAPNANTPTPWASDSLTHAGGTVVEPSWSMTATSEQGGGTFTLDPWDVTVDIDARRIPIATASFKLSASQVNTYAAYVRAGASTRITLNAGWDRAGVPDVHPVFYGTLTDKDAANGVVVCAAATFDQLLTAPWATSYDVDNSYTTFVQAFNAIRYDWSPIQIPSVDVVGTLPTPSAGQLSGFRSLIIGGGNSWIDGLVAMANSLGCWLRGSLTGPGWLTLSARYDSGTALDVAPFLDPTSVHVIESLDEWAPVVMLTAKWVEAGVEKTATNSYLGVATDDVFGGPAAKEVTVNYRPPGGVLSATDPLGVLYAAAYANRRWQATGSGRALWWLQPRQVVTFGGKTGQIEAIRYGVDAGTMTLTIRPTSAY